MSNFEFVPTQKQVEESNIFRFMKKHGISSLAELSKKAKDELEWFWKEVDADIGVVWDSPYSKILDSSKGIAQSKWFVNGKTNIYKSTVEKFVKLSSNKTAYHFVSEDGTTSKLTYAELDDKVSKLANGLKSLGVKKGDVVAIYLPMIQEAILAILASAKIGAIQTVIFSGYSTESLHVRLQDCNAKVLFVSDGFLRKGKSVSQKETMQKAIHQTKVEKTIVVKYKGVDKYDSSENIVFYDELTESQNSDCPTEIMDSEDPLFILYTSGTTGKPKGVVHVHGGFSVFAGHQAAYLIDLQAQDVLFWPADIGWITGLVWNVYGLLIMGASSVIYDGALDYPSSDRVWKILSEYNATIFGISPTATRLFKKNNEEPLKNFSLNKIKNIPTTGEPLDEDSWWWLFEKVGNKKIPIMNLSGGTEIGGAMLSVFPGMKLKPSTVGIPVPGMNLDVVDDDCNSVKNENGYLIIRSPWPGMTRGLLNDNKRFLETYWSRFHDVWFHGDYVFVDEDDLWYMRGRTDDVINVSGHRMSTAEIEHTVISHEKISDAASIAIPDDLTGEAIVVFFVADNKNDSGLESTVSDFIGEKIGKVAKPKFVFQLSDLPKTRTGKIMRRLLKSKLLGKELGDLSSLENPHILDEVPKIG
ncbi:Acetyl-coenzyme A synthetase protein [Marine Group I thaumarchaeote SCGC AAA799-B03]|uniref:acetate--CoA ligase n=3 Tax=Marine Group I TaxID=905826 RepID=A0A087S7T1_9ARCH|nr:Acetyl-coenzyme A synthetase protein [Marine Group I thaumarchaeote SCGC AAA799-D11]KFM17953.1 Acetyl-coenzyme A synthetase protein [Marine Group I thaumarchaeote SCGC RSA3]KFM21785.1 Acetyl-coenzyme A synthetase protein [Marine Group I thaumarchaeote SCGC AAA799-B03]